MSHIPYNPPMLGPGSRASSTYPLLTLTPPTPRRMHSEDVLAPSMRSEPSGHAGVTASVGQLTLTGPGRATRAHGPRVDAFLPAGLAALAAGGKLLAAIGASATVQARYDHETQNVALGAALLVVGLGCAVTAAIMFGIDVHKERPSHAHGLKAISIGAAITLAAGAAVHQYAVIADNVPLAWGASCISAMGFAAVSVSLPRFFTYSEAQRGLCLARTQDRAIAEQILGSTGLALLTAFAGLKRLSLIHI